MPSCGKKYSPVSHRYFSLLIFQEELQGPFVLDCLDAFVLASALRGRVGSQSQTFMEHLLELYIVYILDSQSLRWHWGYKSEYEASRNLIQSRVHR